MGPKIYDLDPTQIKQVSALNEFKAKTKYGSYETVTADSTELIFYWQVLRLNVLLHKVNFVQIQRDKLCQILRGFIFVDV